MGEDEWIQWRGEGGSAPLECRPCVSNSPALHPPVHPLRASWQTPVPALPTELCQHLGLSNSSMAMVWRDVGWGKGGGRRRDGFLAGGMFPPPLRCPPLPHIHLQLQATLAGQHKLHNSPLDGLLSAMPRSWSDLEWLAGWRSLSHCIDWGPAWTEERGARSIPLPTPTLG